MAIELFNRNGHVCLMFSHLSDEGGEAVQANQFLVIHNDHGCVIDPGGNMAFNEMLLTVGRCRVGVHRVGANAGLWH